MAVMIRVPRLFPKVVEDDNKSRRICVVGDHFPEKGRCR